MIFSYNWLKDYIVGKMPEAKKLVELLTFHSFEIEDIQKIKNDWVLDIKVLPNRAPDCFSHIGIARECATIANCKLQIAALRLKEDKKIKAKDFVELEVKNEDDCPRYTAAVILEVKAGQSPKWMQERLIACGLQPINNIVDITNYVMLETGQPLHAFDLDKINSKLKAPRSRASSLRGRQSSKPQLKTKNLKTIIVRRAKKGEKIKTLDDKTYTLDEDVLVIADEKKPIAIAGIKGGFSTGIDKQTKNVLIEAGNWNPVVTRRTSQKLKLRTDASLRFEHGIDPNLIDFAQQRVCSLIQEIGGGKVAQGLVDFYPHKVPVKKIKFDLDYVERLLGVKIPKQKILDILKKLSFKTKEIAPPNIVLVEVPTIRLDVSIPEDLVEEIGRIYGYEKISSAYPLIALIAPVRNDELFWERDVKNALKESGFCEAYNYSFVGAGEKECFFFNEKELVELENPISSFNRYLRPSLIPNLLKNVKENFKFFDGIKIFEIGKVFNRFKIKDLRFKILEKKMLTGVLAKKGMPACNASRSDAGRGDEGFYELKAVIETLLNKLGIADVWYDEYQPTPEDSKLNHWHPGKCAEVKVGGDEIGFLGQIHPRLTEELGIKEHCFLFDLDFEALLRLASEEQVYQPSPSYPALLRDLAVLVPENTKAVEVLNKIEVAGGELVRDVDLFDVYSGQALPEGKENLAFHIIYQAENRTLSSKEVDKVHQKIIKELEENPEWEVRK